MMSGEVSLIPHRMLINQHYHLRLRVVFLYTPFILFILIRGNAFRLARKHVDQPCVSN